MGRSIDPMSEKTKTGSGPAAAPRLIVPMSLQPAIPRRVALQQSSPPLHRLGVTLNEKAQFEKQKPWNGKCASSKLSQLRGSVHTLGCVNSAIAENIRLRVSSKNRTAKSGCATEIRCELTPEMGRAAGGGAGRSWGVGKFKKKV